MLIILALLCPTALASDAPSPPAAVVAQGVGGVAVLVAWTPSDEPVDAYRVYGADADGVLQHLVTVGPDVTALLTSSDYASYAVSSVTLGRESDPSQALTQPCFQIDPYVTPPMWAHNVPTCLGVGALDRLGIGIWLP